MSPTAGLRHLPPRRAARNSGDTREARSPGAVSLLTIVVLVVAGALALAACSSPSNNASGQVASLSGDNASTPGGTEAAPAASNDEKVLKFAKCVRENGIPNFPDPQVDANGNIEARRFGDAAASGGFDPRSDEFRKAMDACRQYLDGVNFGRGGQIDRAKMQDAMLAYTACMRAQGLQVTDPDFSQGPGGPGGPNAGGTGGSGSGQQSGQSGQSPNSSQPGQQGSGGANAGGAPGASPDGPAGPPPGGERGPGGNGILRRLNLDPNDPAVKAADGQCRPAFEKAMTEARQQQ